MLWELIHSVLCPQGVYSLNREDEIYANKLQ